MPPIHVKGEVCAIQLQITPLSPVDVLAVGKVCVGRHAFVCVLDDGCQP